MHAPWLPMQVELGGGAKLCLFPGSDSGFPQAWALCHSQHGGNWASLSVSIRPRAAGAMLQPLWRGRADPSGRGASPRWHGTGCELGLGLGSHARAGGAGHWGLCCVLWSGHCSWSSWGFLLCAGQGRGRSWLWTGKGCSLVCTGAWRCPRRLWDEPRACRTLFPSAVWPVSLHHVSALAPVGSILN